MIFGLKKNTENNDRERKENAELRVLYNDKKK